MHVQGQERGADIQAETATETLAMWLEGHYRAGDEPAMLRVIRRETCRDLSDTEIKNVVYAAFDHGYDAPTVLARLREADRREASIARPPR
jgi:uncharacterized protein YqfB (UPF0267 family)